MGICKLFSDVGNVVGDFFNLYAEMFFQVLEVFFCLHSRFGVRNAANVVTLYDDDGCQDCVDFRLFLVAVVQRCGYTL